MNITWKIILRVIYKLTKSKILLQTKMITYKLRINLINKLKYQIKIFVSKTKISQITKVIVKIKLKTKIHICTNVKRNNAKKSTLL